MFKIGLNPNSCISLITDGSSVYELAPASHQFDKSFPDTIRIMRDAIIHFRRPHSLADYVMTEEEYRSLERAKRLSIAPSSFDEICASRGLVVRRCLEKETAYPNASTAGKVVGFMLGGPFWVGLGKDFAQQFAKQDGDYWREECERIFGLVQTEVQTWIDLDAQIAQEKRKTIQRLEKRWEKFFRLRGLNNLDAMSGSEFESAIALLYEKMGYKVSKKSASGDFGVDVVAIRNGSKTVIQVKRYTKSVGVKAIQEVAAGAYYYQAKKAIVVTSAFFTEQAKNLAASANVELVDRKRLIQMWNEVHKNQDIPEFELQEYERLKAQIDAILGASK